MQAMTPFHRGGSLRPSREDNVVPAPTGDPSSSRRSTAAPNGGRVTSASSPNSITNSTGGAAPSPSDAQQQLLQQLQSLRERRNWLIHVLFVRQEYTNCLQVIEAQLRETEGTCEYALYVKGLLKRMEGSLSESLELLQTAVLISPENAATRSQLGRALHLLGRHEEAIKCFQEAANLRTIKGLAADWEIDYNIGLCCLHRRRYDKAIDAFLQSIATQRHDCAYAQLGKAALLAHNYTTALEVYIEAVTVSPANPDLLAMLGILYLQQGNPAAAFDYLGRCLTIHPTHVDALVAASSIIQDSGDYDVALTKYRIVVSQQPDASQVWNNIGACFMGKRNLYAAVACLRKSVFLFPFDWISIYNLGVVFVTMGRYCSALQCLNAAINLHGAYAPAYMLLGICLGEMKDLPNACRAFERALTMQDDFLVYLNYAVTLWRAEAVAESTAKFLIFRSVWDTLTPTQRREQSSAIPGVVRSLDAALLGGTSAAPQKQTEGKGVITDAPPKPLLSVPAVEASNPADGADTVRGVAGAALAPAEATVIPPEDDAVSGSPLPSPVAAYTKHVDEGEEAPPPPRETAEEKEEKVSEAAEL